MVSHHMPYEKLAFFAAPGICPNPDILKELCVLQMEGAGMRPIFTYQPPQIKADLRGCVQDKYTADRTESL